MKEITFFIGSLSGGGSERVCVNLANGLVKKNWSVNLVVLNNNDDAYLSLLDSKVKLISLNVSTTKYSIVSIFRIVMKLRPKIVMVFSYELTVLLVIMKKLMRADFFLVSRNVNTLSGMLNEGGGIWRKNIVMPLIKSFYGKADYYINQCQGMEADLFNYYPDSKGKSVVINNPVNSCLFTEPLNGIKNNYLLCIGRLEEQKCFSHAIHAFSIVHQRYPSLRLKIVGKGSQEDELKSLAMKLNIESVVDFEGFKSDVKLYYLDALATILTSKYEGFPNVLLESIALGTPIIAYDCPNGPREIIIDGVNGYLADYLNIDSLIANIFNFLEKEWIPERVRKTALCYKEDAILGEYISLLNSFF